MYATGIIAEYNPFHNGHLHHVQESRRLTDQPVIVVMSASWMQRGEPACLSKWLRAQLAVGNGVDLVLELPAAFSLRSAEFFARGAVQLLQATGCVNRLSCGVETPSCDFLALARAATEPQTIARLQELLQQGHSYASAWAQALPAGNLSAPNDILALEYSKALLATNITPLFIQRQDNGYNSTVINSSLASATAIRRALSQGSGSWRQAVPANVRTALEQLQPGCSKQLLWQLVSYRLRLLSTGEIAARCQCSEGLEHVLKQAAGCADWDSAVACCTKKRYTASRIRRLFLQLLLDKPRCYFEQQAPAYLRVLAFNDTGRRLLKAMKATAALPIITKLGQQRLTDTGSAFVQQLALETAATDLWSLLQPDPALQRPGNDFFNSPSYIKNPL